MKLQLGTARATAGKLSYGTWDLVEHPTGGQDRLPVIIAQGNPKGKVFWLTAGIHGNEHSGLQALHLLNGETTSGKIAEGQLIERLLQQHDDPLIVVRELYVRCLSREPSQAELEKIQARLEEQGDLQQSLTDLFWALLNSNEFVFNH